MQNSPLLATKTSPVKHVAATTQQPHEEAKKPFEQVLSKQVKQHQTQSADNENEPVEDTKKQQLPENITDDSVDTLAMDDTQGFVVKTTTDSTLETNIDAQLLARDTTARALKDVTDGEVAITPIPVVQINPDLQTVSQKNLQLDHNTNEKTLTAVKQSLADKQTDASRENTTLIDEQLRASSLQDDDRLLNTRATQVLATDSKQQAAGELPVEKSFNTPTDITTISLQATTTRPTAGLEASQLQAAGASNVIHAFPGKAGWNEAINQKVVWMVGATEQSATLTLNPKDLGPLQVIIHVNNEKADATFISENPEVRKALEEGMSSLRSSMGQAGIELGQANVNTNQQHLASQQESQAKATKHTMSSDASLEDHLASSATRTRVSNGLVDTFA